MHPLVLLLVFVSWLVLHAPILLLTNQLQSSPYMDEPFHFHQAVEIFRNPVHPQWDEKITTPPGLYYVTLLLTGWTVPDLGKLRWTSAVFNAQSLCVIIALVLKRSKGQRSMLSAWLCATKVLTFPPLFFVGQLYYTDAGGLFFLLSAWMCCEYRKTSLALICSAMAVWFRQTNALWVLFIGSLALVEQLDGGKKSYDPRTYLIAMRDSNKLQIFGEFGGYFCIPLTYLGYVVYSNGGHIVHGDKHNHQISQHWAQLCYFAAVVWMSSGLAFDMFMHVKSTLRVLTRYWGGPLVLCLALSVGFVHKFTIVHPFLLADNRHFSFYLWSKFFRVHELAKFVPTPLYAFGMVSGVMELQRSMSPLAVVGFLLTSILSLVPLPLVEPRYFIVPLAFYCILTTTMTSKGKARGDESSLACIVVNLVVNGAVAYLFWFKPFKWADGSVARFMW